MDIQKLAKGLGRLAEWKAIEAVCALSPSDRATVEAARMYQLGQKPRASKNLDHYLEGSGTDLLVSTQELLNEDLGVRAEFFQGVRGRLDELGAKKGDVKTASGVVPISQAVYKNQDWRNALGGINLFWKVEKDAIKVNFVNVYRWHPNDKRITQCVHQAAENLKKSGAKEYRMVGSDYLIPLKDFAAATRLGDDRVQSVL